MARPIPLLAAWWCCCLIQASAAQRHVVVMVWDGMRPDFVSATNTPVLAELATHGTIFRNHHSVFPSATEVNGTALSTGAYPANSGIVGNNLYRPEIDLSKSFHAEAVEAVRRGDSLGGGHYLGRATLPEILRQAGKSTVVAGAKPVVLLADRSPSSRTAGTNVYAGATLPSNLMPLLTNQFGPFPLESARNPSRNDWTTDTLITNLWANGVPDFTLLWMHEPDFSQHQSGPGSPRSLAGMRNADENLGKVLRALELNHARETTDVIVVSDHGCSTVASRVDLAAALNQVGFKAFREFFSKPARGDVLVVSNGGSSFVYVIGHEERVIKRLVQFLQRWPSSGVIFCRTPVPGTFALKEAHLDSGEAPDVVVALRWTSEKSKNGTAGMIDVDVSSFGPGQGAHVTLSSFDMHATLIAVGPDFRAGFSDTLASGNVDLAPTVLWLMGLKPPQPMDGRILSEALTIEGPKMSSPQPHHLQTNAKLDGSPWHQYLNTTEVNGVVYLDEGNRGE